MSRPASSQSDMHGLTGSRPREASLLVRCRDVTSVILSCPSQVSTRDSQPSFPFSLSVPFALSSASLSVFPATRLYFWLRRAPTIYEGFNRRKDDNDDRLTCQSPPRRLLTEHKRRRKKDVSRPPITMRLIFHLLPACALTLGLAAAQMHERYGSLPIAPNGLLPRFVLDKSNPVAKRADVDCGEDKHSCKRP